MPKQQGPLDQVFAALADPTRRAVVARLGRGPAPTMELAQPFAMALPSFTQHLGVLEECGLVRSRKVGRTRIYELTPRPMLEARQWLEEQRLMWEQRLDQLDALLVRMQEPPPESTASEHARSMTQEEHGQGPEQAP